MKKIVLVILFVITTTAITFLNVRQRKDSANIDLKFQDVEAFGQEVEEGEDIPCVAVGGICMFYQNGQPIIYPGLHF